MWCIAFIQETRCHSSRLFFLVFSHWFAMSHSAKDAARIEYSYNARIITRNINEDCNFSPATSIGSEWMGSIKQGPSPLSWTSCIACHRASCMAPQLRFVRMMMMMVIMQQQVFFLSP